ncbi:AraC family transcriptional regulator [Alterisphingorhabdus coralli]|uniref:Helix-turn-helix domain-containing protein n=1 Tax=Alterisphingorhabdus coralli TaxID=3071408 RepID=A0AA97F7J0_9SPHN|nr:helix-turn-helix domain-containing protein [Parasphingorhabdus sp. SCSIO 66989]WOE75418.1 helix-turn-helix domain-containing protein [Parasphingorhabdus sp. SCSIO 66989]
MTDSALDMSGITLRFFSPGDTLAPYISTLYRLDIERGDRPRLEDFLHPEWANIRLVRGEAVTGAIGDAKPRKRSRIFISGPTSISSYFSPGNASIWGIGLLPLGWHMFVGADADNYADRAVDAETDPVFGNLLAVLQSISLDKPEDDEAEAAAILKALNAIVAKQPEPDPRIAKAHSALVDDRLVSVTALAERLAMTERSLERFSRRVFGFPPKLLLRRQRFLRSLAQFMIDPSLRWINTLDLQYHDQAHFSRDFLRFMGMRPGDYAAKPHPIMMAAAKARMAAAGAPMQVLHKPVETNDSD